MSPLENHAIAVCRALRAGGHAAYWVGGCVRDRLLGVPLKDIDIATPAKPQEIAALFDGVRLVGESFGVCRVPFAGEWFEVATFRRDGRYVDHRHPESVEFGTPEEDARRRDFTINALLLDPDTGNIIDFVNGRADLDARLLRAVGDPAARFEEDALRLLRAVRFAARLGFEIEPATWQAMRTLAPTIRHISAERVRDELTAMLVHPSASRAMTLLNDAGLLAEVLPEAVALRGVEQGVRYHPEGDVWVHTLKCLDALALRTPVAAWAVLLHDIAKPATFSRDETGIHFYEHEKVGADMARGILARLRFANEDIDRVESVVRRHMKFAHIEQMRTSTLRRFLAADTIEEDLAVHCADCAGSRGDISAWHFARARMAEFAEEGRAILPPPLINGRDLIALGYKPGPSFATILREVQDLQLEGKIGTKEEALEVARRRHLLRAGDS